MSKKNKNLIQITTLPEICKDYEEKLAKMRKRLLKNKSNNKKIKKWLN